MKTFSLKNTEVTRDWVVFDASDKVLGRFATKIADKLRGKDKPTFTPHVDGGDFVVVINADKVKVTGNKADQKKYYKHSLYPGGLKEKSYKEVLESTPERIIENAVKGMLPKNKLGKSIIKKLKATPPTKFCPNLEFSITKFVVVSRFVAASSNISAIFLNSELLFSVSAV